MSDLPNVSVPPASPPVEPPPPSQPLDGAFTPRSVLDVLLRHPRRIATEAAGTHRRRLIQMLLGIAIAGYAIYGLLAGMFAGGHQLWAAPLKITLGALAAGLLCYPSLYVFSCLAGAEAGPGEALALLAGMLALTAILLIGFAPVCWIFSMSTQSLAFMGALHIAFWAVAAYFGLGFLLGAFRPAAPGHRGHLVVWCLIFVLVTLQMTCALRPIIGTADTFLPTEKRFFLDHWGQTLSETAPSVLE